MFSFFLEPRRAWATRGGRLGNRSQCRITDSIHEEGHKAYQQVRAQHLSRPRAPEWWWYSQREVHESALSCIRIIPIIMDTSRAKF